MALPRNSLFRGKTYRLPYRIRRMEIMGKLTVAQILDWHQRYELTEYSPIALKERMRLWGLFRKFRGDWLVRRCRPG